MLLRGPFSSLPLSVEDNRQIVPEGFVIHRRLALVLCTVVGGFTLSFVACGGNPSTTPTPTTLTPVVGPTPTPPVAIGSCPIGHRSTAPASQPGEGGPPNAVTAAIDKALAAHPAHFLPW